MFEKIGGANTIDQLVDDFYSIMREDPKAARCLATHSGREMKESAKKLKAFLSGWLGGPQVYLETYGHPRLRMRHFPFSIGQDEAHEWLYCMSEALKRSELSEDVQAHLIQAFAQVTEMLTNKSL